MVEPRGQDGRLPDALDPAIVESGKRAVRLVNGVVGTIERVDAEHAPAVGENEFEKFGVLAHRGFQDCKRARRDLAPAPVPHHDAARCVGEGRTQKPT